MSCASQRTVCLRIRGPLVRADLAGLKRRACDLISSSGALVLRCDLAGVLADAVAVDALARLKLAAGANGCQLQIVGACPELTALIDFMGLADALRE
jgi:ABC-type transporter Mla MlaB component